MQLTSSHYQIIFFIFTIFFIYLLLSKRYKESFYFFLFSLPFKNVYLYVGSLYLELWKTYSLIYLIFLPAYLLKEFKNTHVSSVVFLILIYIIYASVLTILYGYWLSDEVLKNVGIFKEYLRPIVQIAFLLLFVNLIFIPSYFLNKRADLITSMKYYLNAMIFLSVLGIIQAILLYSIGHNIFPIPRLDEILQELVALNGVEETFIMLQYRITSICTEPKNFAVFLSFAIIILVEFKKYKIYEYKYHKQILILFSINLILTFSTTGYIAIILYFTIKSFSSSAKYYILGIIILVASYLTIDIITTLVDARIIDKLKLEGVDQGILLFFLDQQLYSIFGVGYGNIHKFAVTYLELSTYSAFGNTSFTAISGVLYLIGSVGIVGLLFFYTILLRLYFLIKEYKDDLASVIANIFFLYIIFNLMRNEPLVYIMAGISLAYINIKKNERIDYKQYNEK